MADDSLPLIMAAEPPYRCTRDCPRSNSNGKNRLGRLLGRSNRRFEREEEKKKRDRFQQKEEKEDRNRFKQNGEEEERNRFEEEERDRFKEEDRDRFKEEDRDRFKEEETGERGSKQIRKR